MRYVVGLFVVALLFSLCSCRSPYSDAGSPCASERYNLLMYKDKLSHAELMEYDSLTKECEAYISREYPSRSFSNTLLIMIVALVVTAFALSPGLSRW